MQFVSQKYVLNLPGVGSDGAMYLYWLVGYEVWQIAGEPGKADTPVG